MFTPFDSTPTPADRLIAFLGFTAFGVALLLVTSTIVWLKHRRQPAKRAGGLTVCVWVAGCYVLCGTYGAFFGSDKRYLMTFGGIGLIAGPILGNIHASFVERRFLSRSDSMDLASTISPPIGTLGAVNPYAPPASIEIERAHKN